MTEALLRTIRETADPTRWRLYMLLGFIGPMKVGPLARMAGVSAAVMRRHLEAMAEVGLVERTGEGRELRWQRTPAPDSKQAPGLRVADDDDDVERLVQSREFGEWLKVIVETGGDLVRSFIEERDKISPSWFAATDVQEYALYLSRDELAALSRDLEEVVHARLDVSRRRLEAQDPEAKPIYVSTRAVVWPKTQGGHQQ